MPTLKERTETLESDFSNVKTDIEAIKKDMVEVIELKDTINDVLSTANKIWATMKWGSPPIISALIAAGVMSDKLGRAVSAIFQ